MCEYFILTNSNINDTRVFRPCGGCLAVINMSMSMFLLVLFCVGSEGKTYVSITLLGVIADKNLVPIMCLYDGNISVTVLFND